MTSDATQNKANRDDNFNATSPPFNFLPTKLDIALTNLDGNLQLSHGWSLFAGRIFLASHHMANG